MTPPDAPDASRSSGEPEKQPVATTTDDWSLGVLMQGRECKKCHATDVHGFDSPAFGKSWFCGTCGIVSLGGGYEPPKSAPVLVSPDVPEEPQPTLDDGQITEQFGPWRHRDPHPTVPTRAWVDVDVGIVAMVDYLNTIPGVRTMASCQGTLGEGGPHPYRAQVMASWPTDVEPRLFAEFDVTVEGDQWGYLHPRDGWSPPSNSGRASERAPDDILATFRRYAEAASEYADCLKRAYMGDFRSVAEDRDLDDAVRELREVRTEFVAELTHLRAERDTLRRFCGVALQATRVHEIGDWDGGDLQDAMLSCGLIAEVQATEPCGEACRCAEYDDFPQTCYRVSGLGERCLAARPTSSTAEG